MEGMPKKEQSSIEQKIEELQKEWKHLSLLWDRNGFSSNPLKEANAEILSAEKEITENIVEILNCNNEIAEIVYDRARKLRALATDNRIHVRAAIHVSNVCRQNCLCCPMRSDNIVRENIRRATSKEIILIADEARKLGFRNLFIQSGEDNKILFVVAEALKMIFEKYPNMIATLNLGSLNREEYELLFRAGAENYVIKHETANRIIHKELRQLPIEKRIDSMLLAREVGFEIGTGNILGIPGQTDADLADDIIFMGRSKISKILSCTPYTPSNVLPEQYRNQQAGNFEKTKRFIALLRIIFPSSDIHAPSNADSPKINKSNNNLTGQANLIMAGANEISIEFTPKGIADLYGLYDIGTERHRTGIKEARQIERETGLELDLVKDLS